MTYDDFMKILEDTGSMIVSKDLFKELLDSTYRITAVEKKKIYDDAYNLGYSVAKFERQGHWTTDFICSLCGCKCYPFDIDFGDYNYCPNCGARMINEERGNKR